MSEALSRPIPSLATPTANALGATSMSVIDICFQNIDSLNPEMLERSRHSPTTIEVPPNASALEIANYVDHYNLYTVLVKDEQGQIRGALFPHWVRDQVSRYFGMTFNNLSEALAELAQRPAEAMRHYRHEWLNFERPSLLWCETGSHFTYTLPCPEHP